MNKIIIITLAMFLFSSLAVSADCDIAAGEVCLKDPLTNSMESDTPEEIIGKAINAVLGIVGSLALVMFIYGGIVWMTAAGNDQRVQRGKDTLLWAVIGLVVIFSSYALVRFVINNVIGGNP